MKCSPKTKRMSGGRGMDFDRQWTVFALEAENDTSGMARIAMEHNRAIRELTERMEKAEAEANRLREGLLAFVRNATRMYPTGVSAQHIRELLDGAP